MYSYAAVANRLNKVKIRWVGSGLPAYAKELYGDAFGEGRATAQEYLMCYIWTLFVGSEKEDLAQIRRWLVATERNAREEREAGGAGH